MRKSISTLVCLAVTLAAILIVPSSIIAGPLPLAAVGVPAGDVKAENAACYGFGWRGWGVYAGWFRPACAGAWVTPGYVVPAPVYAPAVVAPAYPAAGRCWVPPGPDGRPGYWAAC
jgi:hypothetical protein